MPYRRYYLDLGCSQELVDLELPTMAMNALMNSQILTLPQLLDVTAKDLLEMKYLGKKALLHIRKALRKRGLYLKFDNVREAEDSISTPFQSSLIGFDGSKIEVSLNKDGTTTFHHPDEGYAVIPSWLFRLLKWEIKPA